MQTLKLTNSKQDIETAGKLLKDGELVAIPTETVYGLAADALNGEAVANIFKAKGRPMDNPLIVHIADLSQVDDLVAFVPPVLEDLAKAFWPGPLTVIMEKSDLIPDEVSAGLDTVAIRMPSHPVARAIIGLSSLKIITFGPRPQDFFACNAPIKGLYEIGVEIEENSELDLLVAFREPENESMRSAQTWQRKWVKEDTTPI